MRTQQHCLKIEDLNIKVTTADKIVATLKNFLIDDLNFSLDRVTELESRTRDGFIPHSHNKGGIEAVGFRMQNDDGTGFENADATLEKYRQYDLECFAKDNSLSLDAVWTEEQLEKFDDYRNNDSESTVLFSADLMLTSENELNVRLCVCVKDAPYHRQYDDKIEVDLEFKNITDLKKQLKTLAKRQDVELFAENVSDSY